MIPLIKHVLFAFFLDELAFRRWVRGALAAWALGGLAFASSIQATLGLADDRMKYVKATCVFAGFIWGAMQSSAKKAPEPAP